LRRLDAYPSGNFAARVGWELHLGRTWSLAAMSEWGLLLTAGVDAIDHEGADDVD
jgi:hypothetical protein